MALAAGSRFGPYEVGEVIGAGGMGEVYRATDTTLDRDVAIKALPESFASDPGRVARFEHEARTLASLNHANIAQVHGLERADDTIVIIMELVDGPTLADRIARGPLPADEALNIAKQIADALEAAHQRGIVHRDLKPANIKLRPDGTVKVLDFGVAKALDLHQQISGSSARSLTTPAVTEAGVILGTAAYMSPEQARGKQVDQRTDIWAFGCVLYEMLTGQPAFGGEDVSVTLARVLERDTDLASMPAGITPAVRRTIELCLQKDPRKRLHAIGDVRLGLEGELESDYPTTAGLVTSGPPLWRRLVSGATIGIAAALVTAIGFWLTTEPEQPQPMIRFDLDLSPDQTFANMARDVIAISPDGRYLAYNLVDGLYLRALDSSDGQLVPGTAGTVANPFFSPDGEWIGYFDVVDDQMKKMRVNGGSSVSLTPLAVPPQGASWTTDGSIIFGQLDGIMRVSENGGAPELLIEARNETLWDPQMLPDGSILFTSFGAGVIGSISLQTPGLDDRTELFAGERAVYLRTGQIVGASPFTSVAGTLFLRSFDLRTRTIGVPVPIEEGIWYTQQRTHFAVAEAGTLIFAVGPSVSTATDTVLALADRNGNVERLDVEVGQYRGPRVSPDGTEIAVEIIGANGRSSIWIFDLSGNRAARSLLGAGNNARPIWTPDGERITFASDRDGTWGIYWQAADGSGVAERLTIAEDNVEHWPDSWSSDMKTLLFTRIEGSLESIISQTVWAVSLDEAGRPGQAAAVVTTRSGGAALSPNGEWVAYRSSDASLGTANQLHIVPFPPNGTIYSVTDEGGSYPIWSRDGSELLYRRPAGAGGVSLTLASIEVAAGASFAWGNETVLPIPGAVSFFGYRDYDLMPDEEHFVIVVNTDSRASLERASIHVATNWVEYVNRRAGPR